MTDETVPQLPTDDGGKQTFQIVPTLDGYLDLEGRIAHLEAHTPATDDGNSDPDGVVTEDDLDVIHGRIDRHRSEIEEIKKRYNALIRYLDATVLTSAQATSQDTVQPTARRDLVQ